LIDPIEVYQLGDYRPILGYLGTTYIEEFTEHMKLLGGQFILNLRTRCQTTAIKYTRSAVPRIMYSTLTEPTILLPVKFTFKKQAKPVRLALGQERTSLEDSSPIEPAN